MPTLRGDEPAIWPREDNPPSQQPFSFLQRSGVRARRRLSLGPGPARWRAKPPERSLLPPAVQRPFALLSSMLLLSYLEGLTEHQSDRRMHGSTSPHLLAYRAHVTYMKPRRSAELMAMLKLPM